MIGTKFNGIYCDPFADDEECGPDGILISPKLARYETQLREFASEITEWVNNYSKLSHNEKFAAKNKLEIRIQKRLAEIVRG
jgi:hypothetical protein